MTIETTAAGTAASSDTVDAASLQTLSERLAGESGLKAKASLLRKERQDWEKRELSASNRRQLEILVETYKLSLQHDENELRAMAETLDISMNAATPAATIAVKIVFGDNDRRRASKLGQVLTVAHAEQVLSDKLISWIGLSGGIEAIRLKKEKPAETPKARGKKVALAKPVPLFTIPATAVADLKDGVDGFLVHLSRRSGDGHDVLFSLNMEAVLNAVFAAIAKLDDDKSAEEPGATPRSVIIDGISSKGLTVAMKDAVEA